MRLTRRGWTLSAGVLVLALAGAGVFAYQSFVGLVFQNRCTARAAGGEVSLSPEQTGNAATIAAVATRRKLPERAVVVALATAMQESKLRNIEHGDRDSVGLFQQRPSQGWGSPGQILDPVYASGRFYEALVEIPGYRALAVTEAAQRVQRSATPRAYAKHEEEARVLARALTGAEEGALTCALRGRDDARQSMGSSGLTPRGDEVRAEVAKAFGKVSLGGFAPGGVKSGHMPGSAHYEGRAVDVLTRPVNAANQRKGWAVAHWAVANADRLGITEVIYDGRIWTSRRSSKGWRDYSAPDGRSDNPVVMHLDHVHLTVA
jgi:hypothetical protein